MREALREFKRARIIEQASKSFYERGYEATSIELLASALNVTKPFIYSYFPNKLAILEAVYERSSQRLVETLQAELNGAGPPADRLRKFIIAFVLENITHQASSGVFLQEEKQLSKKQLGKIRKLEKSFNDSLTALIRAGADDGSFKVNDPSIASLSLSGMVRWVHRWYRPGGRLLPEQIAAEIAELALKMLQARHDA